MGEEGCGRHRRRKNIEEHVREGESRSGKREVKREEEKTYVAKRKCVNPLSSVVFEGFGPVDDSGSFGSSGDDFHGDSCGFTGCVLAVSSGALVVADVSVSPSSCGVLGEVFSSDSDFEIVKPQSFSFSRQRQPNMGSGLSSACKKSYLDNSEALKVGTKELEDHELAPSEPRVDIDHTSRQARGEQSQGLFLIFSRQGATEILVACVARWEEHLRMLIVLERKCTDLSEANEQLSEKQVLLTTLMESTKSLQKVALEEFQRKIFQELKELEEQKSKEVLELLGRKHKLGKLEKERDRARMLQEREPSGAEGDFNVATDSSSFCSCSPSLAHDVDGAMSTPPWEGQRLVER